MSGRSCRSKFQKNNQKGNCEQNYKHCCKPLGLGKILGSFNMWRPQLGQRSKPPNTARTTWQVSLDIAQVDPCNQTNEKQESSWWLRSSCHNSCPVFHMLSCSRWWMTSQNRIYTIVYLARFPADVRPIAHLHVLMCYISFVYIYIYYTFPGATTSPKTNRDSGAIRNLKNTLWQLANTPLRIVCQPWSKHSTRWLGLLVRIGISVGKMFPRPFTRTDGFRGTRTFPSIPVSSLSIQCWQVVPSGIA